MIKEFECYHGAVISRIIHEYGNRIIIEPYPSISNSSYIINKSICLFVKYSKKRMSPWSFTFKKEHQDEISKMKLKYKKVFTIFVCGTDGIVCLNYDELKSLLDENHESVEWIGIWRNPREKYKVKGTDGKLLFKISENEFPFKLFA